jgi:hypothetical protein
MDIELLNYRLRRISLLNTAVSVYNDQKDEIERFIIMPQEVDCNIFDRSEFKTISFITEDAILTSTIIKVLPLNPENYRTNLNPILNYKNAIPQGIVINNPLDNNKLVFDVKTLMTGNFFSNFMDYITNAI